MGETKRFAAIDIGSNTVKLTIAERTPSGELLAVYDAGSTTRLGEGIIHRRLREAAIRRTLVALAECVRIGSEYGVDAYAVIGTSALRDAANGDEFVQRAAEVGLAVDVVDGEEEARLSALAVRSDPRWSTLSHLLVVDIGGGSTELIVDDGGTVRAQSLQIGAVRLTEGVLTSDPPTIVQLDAARSVAAKTISQLSLSHTDRVTVGVGGTVTNMGSVYRQSLGLDGRTELHGQRLPQTEIERQIALYASMTVQERRTVAGLDPSRADIILAGAIILNRVLYAARAAEVLVSCRGLRWGVLHDRFGPRGG